MSTNDNSFGPKLEYSEGIHAKKYRTEGESFSEAQARFAHTLADSSSHFRKLYNILLGMRFMGGGRTQIAIGAPRKVTAFNCFVSGILEDSMDDIMSKAHEAATTMRLGGGIGYDFSTLRPRGDHIVSLDSKSSGPVSFMGIYDAVCATISSAGHRRGAQMGVLRVDHPDIEEFIRAKQNQTELRAFNISVGITDKFMEALLNKEEFPLVFEGRVYKTISAEYLWEEIMRSTWEWAEPGVLFLDTINKTNNLAYCETISATNPCLHPDSIVETVCGRKRIADITEPTQVYTMDGAGNLSTSMASASFVSKRNAATVKITLDTGKELICTPDHKIWCHDRWVEAQHLEAGTRVGHLLRTKKSEAHSRVRLNTGDSPYVAEHRFVADEVYGVSIEDDVHHVDENTFNNSIDNLEVLRHAEYSTLTNTGADKSSMLRDFTGRFSKVSKKKQRTSRSMPEELKSNMPHQFGGTILSVEEGPTCDVYDITVEGTHNFIANYMVVHNCAEQPLPPYGACLLGSFNLTKYIVGGGMEVRTFDIEQLKSDIPHVVRAMDNIHDNTIFPLEEQRAESQNKRRMGLGVTGVANAGELLGHVYASPEFITWMEEVLEVIRDGCYNASIDLAKEKGSFPDLNTEEYCKSEFIKTLPQSIRRRIKKYGIRNSHLLSIAPTGTISLSADNCSSGIEPMYALSVIRTVQSFDGAHQIELEDYAYKKYGIRGKTSNMCSAEEHLSVLGAATKYVDSAVSKTINVSPDMPWDEFKNIYLRAWQLGCKGVTTFNPSGKRFGILSATTTEDKTAEACYIDPETQVKTCE